MGTQFEVAGFAAVHSLAALAGAALEVNTALAGAADVPSVLTAVVVHDSLAFRLVSYGSRHFEEAKSSNSASLMSVQSMSEPSM